MYSRFYKYILTCLFSIAAYSQVLVAQLSSAENIDPPARATDVKTIDNIDYKPYKLRTFSDNAIKQYKQQAAYNYSTYEMAMTDSAEMVSDDDEPKKVYGTQSRSSSINLPNINIDYFFIFLIVVAAITIILVLLRINPISLYNRNAALEAPTAQVNEDINNLPIDAELQLAIANKNYILATRLYYLQLLKKLHNKNTILWKINKTNHDYIAEIKNQNHLKQFTEITNYFEHICYGNNEINETTFAHIQTKLLQFEQAI